VFLGLRQTLIEEPADIEAVVARVTRLLRDGLSRARLDE
jgi:hypothetical protein